MGSNWQRSGQIFEGLGHDAEGSWSVAWLFVKKMCCVLHVFRKSLRVFRGLWDKLIRVRDLYIYIYILLKYYYIQHQDLSNNN